VADPSQFFQDKSIEDLKAIEHGGRVLIPDAFRVKNAQGVIVEKPTLVRVPSEGERGRARIDAVILVGERFPKIMGTDPKMWTIERAKAVVGAEVFDDIDTYAIVARSTFEPKITDKPVQYMLLTVLYDSYTKNTVFDIWDRINMYADMFNPRLEDPTEEQFWGAVESIARVRSLLPLAVIAGSAQSNFIMRMASELSKSRTPKSTSTSPETSTSG
jgi:hypothetical protein